MSLLKRYFYFDAYCSIEIYIAIHTCDCSIRVRISLAISDLPSGMITIPCFHHAIIINTARPRSLCSNKYIVKRCGL